MKILITKAIKISLLVGIFLSSMTTFCMADDWPESFANSSRSKDIRLEYRISGMSVIMVINLPQLGWTYRLILEKDTHELVSTEIARNPGDWKDPKWRPNDETRVDEKTKTIVSTVHAAILNLGEASDRIGDRIAPRKDFEKIAANLIGGPIKPLAVELDDELILTSLGAVKEGTIETRARKTATAPRVTKTEPTPLEHQSPELDKQKRPSYGIPSSEPALGIDVNGDGVVNIFDLTLVAQEANKDTDRDNKADVDGNGIVNSTDTHLVAERFGEIIARNKVIQPLGQSLGVTTPILRWRQRHYKEH